MDTLSSPPPFGTPSDVPAPGPAPAKTRSSGRRIAKGVLLGLLILVAGGLVFVFLHTAEIQWTVSYDAGMTRARMENRPVLIDFSQHG